MVCDSPLRSEVSSLFVLEDRTKSLRVGSKWFCDLNGEGVFRVKEVRYTLDDIFLPSAPEATRWVKYIPIKINIFAWRAWLNRLR
ncbi:hypothetical protein Tco_1407459 [Tanacetum coccineum]